jgi:hypothetical protein
MKLRTPQHAQEARLSASEMRETKGYLAAEAPGADLSVVRTAASTAMAVSGPVGADTSAAEDLLTEFAPGLRGAAKPGASGAPGVKDYGEPWKELLVDHLTELQGTPGPGGFPSIEAMLGHYDHNKCVHGDSLGVRWFLENRKEILGVLKVAALVEFSPVWEAALARATDLHQAAPEGAREVAPSVPDVLGEDL